jgi:carbamoyl-phosphate synthase large subunit
MFKGKKIFISGAAGVIGNEMVDMLLNQQAILFLGDLKPCPERWYNKLDYFQGDLNELCFDELNEFQPEYFIHLAATFERSAETYDFWGENFRHNVQLSNHLMTLIKEIKSIKSVVYASSYLIYNPQLYNFETCQVIPYSLKETDPIYPRNLTGMAKLAHEIELRFLDKFKNNQFTISIPRIYRGYGKNSRDVISRWVRSLLNNEEIKVYKPEGFFDYIYAKDTAEGILRIAEKRVSGIINLGTGKSRKVSEVIETLKSFFPNMKVSFEESEILYEASQADITRLLNEIKWSPIYSIEKGIKEIIDFEKSRLEDPVYNFGSILITSASKKIGLVKSVKVAAKKISDKILVYTGDLNKSSISKYFADGFYEMPKTVDSNKVDILSWCKKNNVNAIIPTRDGELLFWSSWKNELLAHGISVMVPDYESVNTCLDKLIFFEKSINDGLPIINTSLEIEKIKAESFVVKERYGAGSFSIAINVDKDTAKTHAYSLENPIFQPYVSGKEISVDAYISKTRKVKGLITRHRELIENGESVITKTFFDDELNKILIPFIEKLNLYGHVILQLLIDESNSINIIECNSRFGGASTLSIKAGLDSFYWFINEANDINIDDYPFQIKKQSITQIRFPQDIYLYDSSF